MAPIVFISYSHKDEEQKKQLEKFLDVLEFQLELEIWSDNRIPPGSDWEEEIEQAISKASAAILLITADFLASDFIKKKELPEILKRRRKEGLAIFPIIAKYCPWEEVGWLAKMEVRPKGKSPVWGDEGHHAEKKLTDIVYEISDCIKKEKISLDSIEQEIDAIDDEPPKSQISELNKIGRSTIEKFIEKNKQTQLIGGKYRIKEPIGKGGMSKVFRASHELIDPELDLNKKVRDVAIKIIFPGYTITESIKDEFIKEAKILGKLKHDNIIRLYDFGIESIDNVKFFYLVMDYAEGGTLADHLQKSASLTPEETRCILEKICKALQHAHSFCIDQKSKGIIHRDLKPANILFDSKGGVLVADFGIAKILQDIPIQQSYTQGVGTEGYRSPEQSHGEDVNAASDIYSLGIMLYEILNGDMPDTTIFKKEYSTIDWEKDKQNFSEVVKSVIDKATQYDPKKRYKTAEELAEAFSNAVSLPDYHKVIESIRIYIEESSWKDDPILNNFKRKKIYCPVRLVYKGQKLEPYEAVHKFREAIIEGEIGSGKSSLIAHLVEGVLKYEGRLSYIPIPINLQDLAKIELTSNNPLDTLLKPLFLSKYENLRDDLHTYWEKGRLWLLIDNIDRLKKENQDQIKQLIDQLNKENSGKQNCIWLTVRPQFYRGDNKPKKFKQICVRPPTIPEIWQYLRSWRVKLGKSWKKLYDLWISSSPYLSRQDLFILNLAIKFYMNPQKQSLYHALTANYLKKLLPYGLQTEENIEIVNSRLISMLVEQWETIDKETWQNWEEQIPKKLFEKHWPLEDHDHLRLRLTVCKTIFIENETEACIPVPKFMLNYWLQEAFLKAKWNATKSTELYEKLAILMKKDPDITLLCLNRLSQEDWEEAYLTCLIKFRLLKKICG